MENNKMNWEGTLSSVKRQEVPPFLFTRIEARIDTLKKGYFTPALSKALLFGVICLITVNAFTFISNPLKKNDTEVLIKSFGVITSENIYEQP